MLFFDAILKELTERSRRSGSALSRKAPRFQAQMRHQGPARQLQRSPLLVGPLLGYVCDGPTRVDESDITDCEFNSPVVLNDSGLAGHLK